jgi:hypothetical protein
LASEAAATTRRPDSNAKEYAQLAKEVAPIIRQEARQVNILMGGGWLPDRNEGLRTILEAGACSLVDVMTIHAYRWHKPSERSLPELP